MVSKSWAYPAVMATVTFMKYTFRNSLLGCQLLALEKAFTKLLKLDAGIVGKSVLRKMCPEVTFS